MNIIERGKAFVQGLRELAGRSAWDWRRCPRCGGTETVRNGKRKVHPWTLEGRTEVHRFAVDHWQHAGSSIRRTVEIVRSILGKQERWRLFVAESEEKEKCHLSHSTLHRWLDKAGIEARKAVPGQLEGVGSSGQVGTDGLWARLLQGQKKVVLALVDTVTGVIWPPLVVGREDRELSWGRVFRQAELAGLDPNCLRGVTSDGAKGLIGYLGRVLSWVNHQRCHFHIWRNLGGELTARVNEAAEGLAGAAAKAVKKRVRSGLVALVRGVLDAGSYAEAEAALAKLKAHQLGGKLAATLEEHLDAAMVHILEYNRGLARVSPEWYWRDFRLRLNRGRNHRSDQRLERAALMWAIYRNFTPAQRRSERKRRYRHPGLSPLAVAGAPPGETSYLDALAV